MRISKSIHADSLTVTLGISYKMIERVISRFLINVKKGKLSDNHLEHELDQMGAYLLFHYVECILLPEDAEDFMKCLNQIEIL